MRLSEFLLARIAEDEAAAKPISDDGPWGADAHEVYCPAGIVPAATYGPEFAEHIARHDPERVLAECEAKRSVVNQCSDIDPFEGADILRALAVVFADHSDYDETWRPT